MTVNIILVNGNIEYVYQDFQEACKKYQELKKELIERVCVENTKYTVDGDIDTYSITISVKTPEKQSLKMVNMHVI